MLYAVYNYPENGHSFEQDKCQEIGLVVGKEYEISSIRGNDPLPTKKNLLRLLFTGELGEFCAYFPEWSEKALDIQREVDNAYRELAVAWDEYKHLESQKYFALAIKDVPYNGILFQARKLNKTVNESWNDWPLEKKISMFEKE